MLKLSSLVDVSTAVDLAELNREAGLEFLTQSGHEIETDLRQFVTS